MSESKFALFGAGFWSQFQLAGWHELRGVRCAAIYNRTRSKAEQLASQFGISSVYDDPAELLACHPDLDFVDIVTDVDSHFELTQLALDRRLPVICQKPLAATLDLARQLSRHSEVAGVPLLVHENWRWQAPIRRLKQILDSGQLGTIVRARIDYAHSFPVFDNQPFLKSVPRFILADMGTHILDVARFLFGEAALVFCQARRIHQDIQGEDVATAVLTMTSGLPVTCNLSYASHWEFDAFPQTMIAVEGTSGGVSLRPGFKLLIADANGHRSETVPIAEYAWSDPAYGVVHASIVDCHRNLLQNLQHTGLAETTAQDNLKTLELVEACYASITSNSVIRTES
ncbi:MAG: Gfo/Idh/MocA family oxidoreductase [Pirellulales bacterium]